MSISFFSIPDAGKTVLRVTVVLAVVAATGCTRFHRQPLSAEKSLAALEQRSLADSSLKRFIETGRRDTLAGWPLATWDLQDLTLAAYFFSPELDLARARWAAARGATSAAGERPNPVLEVVPGRNETTTTPSPWIPTSLLTFTLETAGKRGHRIAEAAQLSEAARLNISSVAWQVRSRVQNSLLEVYAARETEVLAKKQQELRAERLRLLELQHTAGEVSAFDVTQERLAFESNGITLRDAQRLSAEATVQLAAAVGVPSASLDNIAFSFDSLLQVPDELPLADLRRQALLHRPDILAALAAYEASEAKLRLEIARQYPNINLGPGYEYDQGDNKWSLGLGFELPLLNRNRGAIAEAEARRAESAAQFNVLQSSVLAEIDDAIAGYNAALHQQADIDSMLADRSRQEKTAQAVYAAGEISRSELLGVELELNVSALERLDALVRTRQAFGALENALQSPAGLTADVTQAPPEKSETGTGNEHP